MGIETAAYVIAAIAAVGGTAYNISEQGKARKEQKKAREQQQGMADTRAAAEARQQFREERIRRAQIIQSSENTGVSESSGELGALSGLSTQYASNQGYNLGMIDKANAVSLFSQRASDHLQRGAQGQAIGSAVSSIFSAGAGYINSQPKSTPVQQKNPQGFTPSYFDNLYG